MEKKGIESEFYDNYSLRVKVFEYIRDAILDGYYKPGDGLVETKLAKELGVSRTPIREAFRQLELEGLVSCIPNKGVVVQGVSEQDIKDIYTLREMIEGLAGRWASERITEDELKQLEETMELMEYYTKKDDMEQVAKLDNRFHNIIYKACKSKILGYTLTNFHHFIQKARLESLRYHGRAVRALQEHKLIVEAMENKDSEKSEVLLTKHVSNASINLIEHKDDVNREGE